MLLHNSQPAQQWTGILTCGAPAWKKKTAKNIEAGLGFGLPNCFSLGRPLDTNIAVRGYYLGCPVWGLKAWSGLFFERRTPSRNYLEHYATVFNSVEGNTTFYGTPKKSTVQRWDAQTPADFRFCFKFPRSISHDKALHDSASETKLFLDTLALLKDKLGTLFLQLPPDFTPQRLPSLSNFLRQLPADFSYAVEVRHPSFFVGNDEARFCELLQRHNIDRVVFDTRVLHRSRDQCSEVIAAQQKKPKLPIRKSATGRHPFLRLMVVDDLEQSQTCLSSWASVVAEWMQAGLIPYVFLHTPADVYAPHMARRFHGLLAAQLPDIETGTMAPWPVARAEEDGNYVQLAML